MTGAARMPPLALRPAPRARGLLAVLGAHALLLLALLHGAPVAPRHRPAPTASAAPASPSPALLWLWPATPIGRPAAPAALAADRPGDRSPPPGRTAPPADARRVAGQPADAPPASERPAAPQAITLPAPGAPAEAPAGHSAAATTPAPPAPLNLALPARPPASAPPPAALATQDPRVHTPRGAGDRFATTLGTELALQVQPLNGGGQRLQQGSRCVEVRPARESQLNPFDRGAQALPRQVTGC